ncbi:transcriptional regulator [Vibrio agarivorans]|nr:transcriptional regulator [Vibrio agarivorans]
MDTEHPLVKNILTNEERRIGYHDHLVILILCKNTGKVTTKEELLTGAWPGKHVSEGSLTQSIRSIRQLLEDSGKEQKYLKTVAKIGYKFESETVQKTHEKDIGHTLRNISEHVISESEGLVAAPHEAQKLKVDKPENNVLSYTCITLGLVFLLIAVYLPFFNSKPKFEASSWISMEKVQVSELLTIYFEPGLDTRDISVGVAPYVAELKRKGELSRAILLYTSKTLSIVTLSDSASPHNVVIILNKNDSSQKLVSIIKEEMHHYDH